MTSFKNSLPKAMLARLRWGKIDRVVEHLLAAEHCDASGCNQAAVAAAVIAFIMASTPPEISFRVFVTASTGSNFPQLYPSPSCAEPPSVADTTEGFAGAETGSAPPIS